MKQKDLFDAMRQAVCKVVYTIGDECDDIADDDNFIADVMYDLSEVNALAVCILSSVEEYKKEREEEKEDDDDDECAV